MPKITNGPTWRRYRYSNGWKVALLTITPAIGLIYTIQFAPHDPAEAVRMHRLAPFGLIVAIFFVLIGIFALLSHREVFVDADGFVRVKKGIGPSLSGETYELTEFDHVAAEMRKVGQGYAGVPTLMLGFAPGRERRGITLTTFSTTAELRAEARALGELIDKPVQISPEASQ